MKSMDERNEKAMAIAKEIQAKFLGADVEAWDPGIVNVMMREGSGEHPTQEFHDAVVDVVRAARKKHNHGADCFIRAESVDEWMSVTVAV